MRLRKEISPWSFKTFIKLFGVLFLFFNVFYVLAGYVDHKEFFKNTEFLFNWLLMGLFYPLLLGTIVTTGSRNATITVGDFGTIPDFNEKLLAVAMKGYALHKDEHNTLELRPTSWFYRITSFLSSENITINWKNEEVIISGSQRKVSAIEDSLSWNQQFKS